MPTPQEILEQLSGSDRELERTMERTRKFFDSSYGNNPGYSGRESCVTDPAAEHLRWLNGPFERALERARETSKRPYPVPGEDG